MKRYMRNPYQKVQSADHYTAEEIAAMLKDASRRAPYLYDYMIDRLYLYDGEKRNTKNAQEYSFLMARQEKDRQNKETPLDNFHSI